MNIMMSRKNDIGLRQLWCGIRNIIMLYAVSHSKTQKKILKNAKYFQMYVIDQITTRSLVSK